MSARGTGTHGALRNCLKYVLQPSKTDSDTLCYIQGPYDGGPFEPDSVYTSFLTLKNEYGKDSGRQYYHTVISFPPNEKINPEQALDYGINFATKAYAGYQVAVAVHTDRGHTHIHFVINSVGFADGKKFELPRKKLKQHKELCNALCEEYGLSIAVKGRHADGTEFDEGEITAWEKEKYRALLRNDKPSYLCDCAVAIVKSKETATSKDEFISAMAAQGWSVQWSDSRKHITFINVDGRKIRDSNLQKTFNIEITKEVLLNEFKRKIERTKNTATRISERKPEFKRRELTPEARKQRTKKAGRTATM
jgi:hypothetical protein